MLKLIFVRFVSLTILLVSTQTSAQREILIPVGKVVLGNYPEGYGNYPPQVIFLPDYNIDQFEVTNEEFAKFVDDSIYQKKEYWIIHGVQDSLAGWNWKEKNQIQCPKFWDLNIKPYWKTDTYSTSANTPVVGVSWFEAYAYAKWAGKRLPTSAEWEKAARGNSEKPGKYQEIGVGYKFPWGNDFFKGQTPPEYHLCNWRLRYWAYGYPDKTKEWKTDGFQIGTAPVGSFSPAGDSPYGIADMVGNVWEWCSDWDASHREQLKVIRGGGWYASGIENLRTAFRYAIGPYARTSYIGFRCVRDIAIEKN